MVAVFVVFCVLLLLLLFCVAVSVFAIDVGVVVVVVAPVVVVCCRLLVCVVAGGVVVVFVWRLLCRVFLCLCLGFFLLFVFPFSSLLLSCLVFSSLWILQTV